MIHYIDVLGDLDDWKDKYKKLVASAQVIIEGKILTMHWLFLDSD
jgi:hypothetical protein